MLTKKENLAAIENFSQNLEIQVAACGKTRVFALCVIKPRWSACLF